ncbi:MAG: radical SAM protein [Catenulispora sp.]|nr:radical SAM protein [Catenulispora sp.]
MRNGALIDLVSSFMDMDRSAVEAIDEEVGGLFVSRFLQRRMAETIEGRDSFTREAFRQFLLPGLYTEVDPTNERPHIVDGYPTVNNSYPNSVALMVTRTCHVKCTYCFRGDLITSRQTHDSQAAQAGIDWIKSHPNVSTVLVTGGDPFTVPAEQLAHIVESLVSIPTVNEIRIDTRALTVKPSSVTDSPEVLDALGAAGGKVWFYSQINSAAEFHPDVDRAIAAIRRAGVPIVNQAVLLKGVNHTPVLMREMVYSAIRRGIRTDYIYLLDGGAEVDSPFNVTDDDIRAIFSELWSTNTSGLAKPRAVYVDPTSNTKAQLLVTPFEGNEAAFDKFLADRRRKYSRRDVDGASS